MYNILNLDADVLQWLKVTFGSSSLSQEQESEATVGTGSLKCTDKVSYVTFTLCRKVHSAWTVWTWSSPYYWCSTCPNVPTKSTSWSWFRPSGLSLIMLHITSQRAIRTKYFNSRNTRSSATCTACLRKLFQGFIFWWSVVLHCMIMKSCCN